ncbi:hypothetical protein RIF29_01926 [Crotalaria pallida]|uniref:Uncharacterized protein n=1 Tax=Crotalaria pallida TaxID=3830 RepID=A0AAN9IYJ7_CROPI
MARKKGRPPKTPSSSSKKTPSAEKRPEASSSLEFSLSDEEALEDIESLTPKKAAELLQSIDLLRQRVQTLSKSLLQEQVLREELDSIQTMINMNPRDPELREKERIIYGRYMKALKDSIAILKQKAKEKWAKDGDQNTAYFHSTIRTSQYRNRILNLVKEEG